MRWHGARPALLWDAPAGVELRVPALDPAWSSSEAAGEALLAEPPASLLPMGTGTIGRRAGRRAGAVLVSDDEDSGTTTTISSRRACTTPAARRRERLALLTYLTDEIGASIPELVQATKRAVG